MEGDWKSGITRARCASNRWSRIIGQRGNLRDKNIVMATVEFSLDSAE